MSAIHLRLATETSIPEAAARYKHSDYSLIVGPGGQVPVAAHRISIDSLTLFFSPDKHLFIGLDGYTNAQKWEYVTLVQPILDRDVALICTETFDEHGIGPSGSGPVHYVYSEVSSLLLIRIGDGPVMQRVRFISCGICGLGVDEDLIEIWVQGVVV